jgi:hypothetical protein
MNERIRELYEQARLQAKSIDADLDPQGWMDLYHQKFAELIVKECGEVAYKAYWDNPETVRGIHIKEKIKQHFGVEK